MTIDPKLIDQLLTNYKKPEDIIGENGLLKELTKAILERALAAEMTDHLGYEKHDPAGHHRGNTRNGKSPKTLKGEFGELELETPRDRKATFDPKIVAKGQTHWTGFDDKIISMYARGMTTREIQGHLEEMYHIEVSPTLISNCNRGRDRGSEAVARAAAGRALSHRVPGRADGEGARRRPRAEQGDLCGAGGEPCTPSQKQNLAVYTKVLTHPYTSILSATIHHSAVTTMSASLPVNLLPIIKSSWLAKLLVCTAMLASSFPSI